MANKVYSLTQSILVKKKTVQKELQCLIAQNHRGLQIDKFIHKLKSKVIKMGV